MKKDNTNILSFEQLIDFINDYYDLNVQLVYKVVQSALNVTIFTFGDAEPKDRFINKVKKHYEFISNLPTGAEAPIFLTNEPKPLSEFSIKDIIS